MQITKKWYDTPDHTSSNNIVPVNKSKNRHLRYYRWGIYKNLVLEWFLFTILKQLKDSYVIADELQTIQRSTSYFNLFSAHLPRFEHPSGLKPYISKFTLVKPESWYFHMKTVVLLLQWQAPIQELTGRRKREHIDIREQKNYCNSGIPHSYNSSHTEGRHTVYSYRL